MNENLKPTLWRTARALSNTGRLKLMRLVANAKGVKGVVELAEEVGLSVAVTSIYLRQLNARGLISVVRSGPYVYYGTGSDRSLPVAIEIQKAFQRLFSRKKLPSDWTERLMPVLHAYSHFRREIIIRDLLKHDHINYAELLRCSGFSEPTFLRHLNILLKAEVVSKDKKGCYFITKPKNSLESVLLSYVVNKGGWYE